MAEEYKVFDLEQNKTSLLLVPIFKEYGPVFTSYLEKVYKLGYYIGDDNISNIRITREKAVYFVLDKEFKKQDYLNFEGFIKTHPSYIADYCPDANEEFSRRRVFILRVPVKYQSSFYYFLHAKYSKMYKEEDLKKYFSDERALGILGKKPIQLKIFLNKLKKLFNVDVDSNSFDKPLEEYALPLEYEKEILNVKNRDIKYFNISLHPLYNKNGEEYTEILG